MNSANSLWQQLNEVGLVSGEQPEEHVLASPWYVKSLLAFCGWLAAVFIFGFLAAAFHGLLDSTSGCLIVGGLMLALAWKLLTTLQSDFLEHLALAVSLAGQCLIIYAVFVLIKPTDAHAWAAMFLLQAALTYAMPNFVHRVYSAFFSAWAFTACAAELQISLVAESLLMFASAWLWLNEFRLPQQLKLTIPLGYGLVLALIVMKGTAVFHHGVVWWQASSPTVEWWLQPWVAEVFQGLVMIYVCWRLLAKYTVGLEQPIAILSLAAIIIISLLSLQVYGLTLGIMILLLGFAGSNYVLQALGLAFLLLYLSAYYYLLDTSLLEKSKTFFLVGLVLLSARYLLKRAKVLNDEH